MKKLLVVFIVLAIAGKVSAQGAGKVALQDLHITTKATESITKRGQGQLILPSAQAGSVHVHDITVTKANGSDAKTGQGDIILTCSNMKEGANNLTKVGAGTLQFMKRGNIISNVVFNDNAGNSTRLVPEPGSNSIIPIGNWSIKVDAKKGFFRLFGDSN